MRRTRTFGCRPLLSFGIGVGLIVGACATPENDVGQGSPSPAEEPAEPVASGNSALIDVAQGSKMSLGVRGGLGPVIEGRSITKAMVTIQDVELVNASGASVALFRDSVTIDLLEVQDDIRSLFGDQAIDAGQFTQVRFRLTSAWIESVDEQGATEVFASEQADRSQFSSVQTVDQLQLAGQDSGGFVTVALPQDGIHVQGSASLALHFALAESLTVQSESVWSFSPRVWIVDQSIFSSVDVQFEASSGDYAEYFSQGFQVVLLDANRRPVCQAALVESSSSIFVASFQYIEFYQGPFTAVLVPPRAFSLSTAVAVSIDVQQSVRVQASVSVTSVQQVSGTTRGGTIAIRTSDQAQVVARSSRGDVVHQGTAPVGPIENVTSQHPAKEPVGPGQQAPGQADPPHLPGLPAPGPAHGGRDGGGGPPPRVDGGGPPPAHDAGGPPPEHDAGGPPPEHDAGGPPPQHDAGGPPPQHDAGGPPPQHDAGGPPPEHDAGGPPPAHDAGGPPPQHDAGGPPPPHDAGGPPPPHDAGGPPPTHDAGGPPPTHDAGGPPPSHSGGKPPSQGGAGPSPSHSGGTPPKQGAGGPAPAGSGNPH